MGEPPYLNDGGENPIFSSLYRKTQGFTRVQRPRIHLISGNGVRLITAAESGIATHPARAGRDLRPHRHAVRVCRERGKLFCEMLVAAGGAFQTKLLFGTPHELLEFVSAGIALIFVDRHRYRSASILSIPADACCRIHDLSHG